MRLLSKVTCVLALLFTLTHITAQKNTLDTHFRDYEIVDFDSRSLKAKANLKRNDFLSVPFTLSEDMQWQLELTVDHRALSESYQISDGTSTRNISQEKLPIVLRGFDQKSNQIHATITVNDDFLYGMIKTVKDVIYFEPLNTFDKTAEANKIIVYKASDVIPNKDNHCASETLKSKKEKLIIEEDHEHSTRMPGECRQVDLVIANDYNVVQNRGANTANWNAGVMANVNTDYDDAFADEIRFVIVQTFLATSGNPSPWGAATDAEALLNNFSSWAPNNLNSHDMGQLWTEDDLTYGGSSGTVGLAWVGNQWGCTGRYHVLEDIGNNATSLRVLVSHEIGHNFSLSHVGGAANIMSSSIQNTTTWAASSISDLNSYIAQSNVNCLGACTGTPPTGGGGNPPDANFDASYISECNPTRLQFNDLSTNSPTSWSWTFQNGTPATSTDQNPQVNFPGAGVYQVALTATNADGSNTQTYNMNLSGIGSPPNASFTSSVSGFTATFDNNTTGGNTYSWAFGDGNTSTAANPSHTYASTGTYSVTLTSNNDCGSDEHVANVTITDQVTAAFTSNTTEVCEGQTITFTNQSSANATEFNWVFENGTPSTSTEENPTVTYNNAGTFNAQLTVSGGGTTDTENKVNYVSVNDVPSPTFTHSINGYVVTFDNNTVGAATYQWAFGDGETSATANPTHTYAGPGTYNVTLTSTNSCGSDTYSAEVIIADEVVAAFTVNETQGCAGDTYVFTNQSTGNITSYEWYFEDGIPETSTDENPSVSFSSPGVKDIRLTVSNSQFTDIELKNNYINIAGVPNAAFTFEVTENTVVFDNNTVGGFTYSWDFGDGNTSIQANPTHTYDGPGDYTVILSSSNGCEEGEIEQVVSIESDIVARFIVDNQEICEGETVNFTNTSEGNITSYFWEFEGGTPATSTDENPVVVYNDSGSFNATLTVSDGSNSDEESKLDYIGVLGAPNTSFTYEINGYLVTFDNNSTGGNIYQWNFGDGESSIQGNPTHTYSAPGVYEVSLLTSNVCDEAQATLTVTIEEVLTASFEQSSPEICEGDQIQFTSTSEGEIDSYVWEFPGGTPSSSTDAQPIISYSAAGNFDVSLTITSIHGGTDVVILENAVSVAEGVNADFSFALSDLTATFANFSTNANSFSWNFGDGNTSNQENPTHTYAQEGDYTVTLIAEGTCGTDEAMEEIPVFNQLLANFMASETNLCPGEEIELLDLSSGNPTEWEWTIEGEEMIIADEQNPVLVLDMPGAYNVELKVRNSEEEDSKMVQQYIEVLPLPEASFSYTSNDLGFNFVSNAENAVSYFWDFGDGNTSTEENPSHVYAEEGDYNVILRVENSCSIAEDEQGVGAYNRLTVGFTASETEVCTGSELQFLDQSSGNATTWEWSFPGGTPAKSEEKNPVVTYNEPGDYDVILTVSSPTEELTETKLRHIRVSEAAISDFDFAVDKNLVSFVNKSENADEISWSFGGSEEVTEFIFEEEKAYEVTLTALNGCSTNEKTKIVDLYAESGTFVDLAIETSTYCRGDEIQFTDKSSSDITEWSWKFPGASPSESTEQNPVVVYEELGSYNVELTVSNGFNVRTILLENYVNVLDKAEAGFEIIQEGNSISLENTASSFTNIEWYINDELFDGTLSEYSFSKNGIYTIKQLVSNACTESEITQDVEINVFPTAGFSVNTTKGCAPLVIEFESKSTENASEVQWIFEGADVESAEGLSPTATYYNYGSFDITVIATNSYGADTIVLKDVIEVLEAPEVAIDYEIEGSTVNFFGIVGEYDRLFWDLGDGNTSDELDFEHSYQNTGIYTVTLTAYVGNCVSTYSTEVSLLFSDVDDLQLESFKVYPNPAIDLVNVSFEDVENVERVEIIDLLGKVIAVEKVTIGTKNIRIYGLINFASGQYLVALHRTNEVPVFKKLIVVK